MNFQQHRVSALIVAGLAALLLAPIASADDWVAKWSNGHKIESKESGHKLKFGGRLQADYHFADSSDFSFEDGFEFRRARLFFSGTIYDRVEFKAQYDFAGGETAVKDLWVGLPNDWGIVKFGHFKESLSLEELTSSKYLSFLERSLPVEAFAPSRNSGIGVEGESGDKINWGIGWFYDADDFGISTDENNTNLTGRIVFRPVYEEGGNVFHIGVGATVKDRASSIRFRARPENHFGGRLVDTGTFAADSATVLNLELATIMGPFWASAEYFNTDVSTPGAGDPTFTGAYVQAGWFLTGESRGYKASEGAFDRSKPNANFGKGSGAWELAFRYSTIDLNDGAISGGEEDNVSVGLNWYLNPATRLMIDYVNADVKDEGTADFFLVRWQVDF